MEQKPKIFGVGLSRTGTTTLTQALRLLGYTAFHFPDTRVTQAELTGYLSGPDVPFHLTVADQYDALLDTPVVAIYRELSKAYPDSLFVLTVRERTSWLASCERFWRNAVPRQYDGPRAGYCKRINTAVYGRLDFDAAAFTEVYERHLAGVMDWFQDQPRRLLVLDICAGEEWRELCAFLEVPAPALPFPHANQSVVKRPAR